MGGRQSHLISVEDAQTRCSKEEWIRYNKSFDNLSNRSKGGESLAKDAFMDALGSAMIPLRLIDRIFEVFDTRKKGALDRDDYLYVFFTHSVLILL